MQIKCVFVFWSVDQKCFAATAYDYTVHTNTRIKMFQMRMQCPNTERRGEQESAAHADIHTK